MTTGGVKVELSKGNVWTLRYQTTELIRLEEETGFTLAELQQRMNAASLSAVVSVLWAGLLHAEPSLTKAEVAKRLDIARLGPVAEKIGEALQAAFPDVEGEDENPPTAE